MTTLVEKRQTPRTPSDNDIDIIVQSNDSLPPETVTARTFDISPTGMGITLDIPMKMGQIISFAKDQEQWQLPDKGIVIWSLKAGDRYRVGLEFLL